MRPQSEVALLDLVRFFDRHRIRHLIIGRRAVILYGGPVLTADHDLWVHPLDKKRTLSLLSDGLGFELSRPPDTRNPIVTGFSGMKKYDLFFHKKITTIENEQMTFEACYERSTLVEDQASGVRFRVPSIDDLIRLKKIREPNLKDEQDIEYLLKAKSLIRRTRRPPKT